MNSKFSMSNCQLDMNFQVIETRRVIEPLNYLVEWFVNLADILLDGPPVQYKIMDYEWKPSQPGHCFGWSAVSLEASISQVLCLAPALIISSTCYSHAHS